ncbi:DNA repair protein RecO [Psychroflexus lacisalsi]|jgi:DNA repair protein RecO (recombination protein O)|uniref:DNA repair protein RecO n=1 Tax=Psychroflexus lacisalsi TaxID=503928 RepID=A0ABN1K3Y8_9FLAO|nr:DNA repair protein RecO [Psychroflexus lacisalsi]MBZ9618741.1 DNA repair protein RecO [Psychroflexus lacisalsi]
MQIKTKAIVISSLKYGEADVIAKCFTLEKGLVSYMLKGIRKSKRGKLRMSMFQQLSLLDIEAFHKENKNLQYLKEVKVSYRYLSLQSNIYKSTMVMFLAEVLKSCIQEEERNEALFYFLQDSFISLDKAESISNFHLQFIVKLTQFLGFYPDNQSIDFPFFDMLNGVFQLKEYNTYSFNNSNSELLKEFMKNSEYNSTNPIKLNQERRKSFLDFMMLYYELHLQGFRKPKSLEVLQQIF